MAAFGLTCLVVAALLGEPTELRARSDDGHMVAHCTNPDDVGDWPCRLRVERDGAELWSRAFPLRLEFLDVTDAGQIVALTEPALNGIADAKYVQTRGSWILLDANGDRTQAVDLPLAGFASAEQQFVLPAAQRALLRTRRTSANGAAETWWSLDIAGREPLGAIEVFPPTTAETITTTLSDVAPIPRGDELLFVWQQQEGGKSLSTVYELRSAQLDVVGTCVEEGRHPASLISLGRDGFDVSINGAAFRRRLPSFEPDPSPPQPAPSAEEPAPRPLELARTFELGSVEERGLLPPLHVQGFAWLADGSIECLGQGFAHGPLIHAHLDSTGRVLTWRFVEQAGEALDVYSEWTRLADGTWIGSHWHKNNARLAVLEPGAQAVEIRGTPWGAKSWQIAPLPEGNCAILREMLGGAWSLEVRTREHGKIASRLVADAKPKSLASLAVRNGDRIGVRMPGGARIELYDVRGEAVGKIELAPEVALEGARQSASMNDSEFGASEGRLYGRPDGWWLQFEQRIVRIGEDGSALESIACEPRTTIDFDAQGEPWSRRAAYWPGALAELRQLRTGRVLPFGAPLQAIADPALRATGFYFHAQLDGHGQLWGYDWAADALDAFDATGRRVQHVRLPAPADGGLGLQYRRGFPGFGQRIWLFDPMTEPSGSVIDCATGAVTQIERPSQGRASSADGAYEVVWDRTSFEIRRRDGAYVATVPRYGSERYHHLLDVRAFRDTHWSVTWFSSPLLHGGPRLGRELYTLDGRYVAPLDKTNPCGVQWRVDLEHKLRTSEAIATRRRDRARFSAPVPRLLQTEYRLGTSAWIAADERELWVLDRPGRRVLVYALPQD
jgi:hypothetical protein